MSNEFEQIKELLIAYRKKNKLERVYCAINESVISITGYRKDRYHPVKVESVFWCDVPEEDSK